MKTSQKTIMLHVRMPQRLIKKLKALAAQRRTAVRALIREMLEYEVENPAFLPKPEEPLAGQIKVLAKQLKVKPAGLDQGWIVEKLSEEAFEADGLETDRVFSLEKRFDPLLQKHRLLAEEIRRTRAALLTDSEDSRSLSDQRKKT